jgi:hypothetical protein
VFNALVGDSEAKTLSHVFLNHIVPDVWYSEGLRTRQSVATLGGKRLDIDVDQNTGQY